MTSVVAGALSDRQLVAQESPSYKSLTELAAVQSALGQFEEAEASYAGALAIYQDVSPFKVAWVEFQRGVMWSEKAGRTKRRAIPRGLKPPTCGLGNRCSISDCVSKARQMRVLRMERPTLRSVLPHLCLKLCQRSEKTGSIPDKKKHLRAA